MEEHILSQATVKLAHWQSVCILDRRLRVQFPYLTYKSKVLLLLRCDSALILGSQENQGRLILERVTTVHKKVMQRKGLAASARSKICGVARNIKIG